MTSLSLHRTGSFNVNRDAEDSTQCGFARGNRTCWFDVTIRSMNQLDENGFLIDNNEVQHYFDRTYAGVTSFKSCETIALRAVNDLRDIVGHDRCLSIKVEIKPGDYAGITAESEFQCPLS